MRHASAKNPANQTFPTRVKRNQSKVESWTFNFRRLPCKQQELLCIHNQRQCFQRGGFDCSEGERRLFDLRRIWDINGVLHSKPTLLKIPCSDESTVGSLQKRVTVV